MIMSANDTLSQEDAEEMLWSADFLDEHDGVFIDFSVLGLILGAVWTQPGKLPPIPKVVSKDKQGAGRVSAWQTVQNSLVDLTASGLTVEIDSKKVALATANEELPLMEHTMTSGAGSPGKTKKWRKNGTTLAGDLAMEKEPPMSPKGKAGPKKFGKLKKVHVQEKKRWSRASVVVGEVAPADVSKRSSNTTDEDESALVRLESAPMCGCGSMMSRRGENEISVSSTLVADWLRDCGSTLDAVELRADFSEYGMAVFAQRDIAAEELAFDLPCPSILDLDMALCDVGVARASELLLSWGISQASIVEFLLCLRLCRARTSEEDRFHAYASNISDGYSETVMNSADEELDHWMKYLERMARNDSAIADLLTSCSQQNCECARKLVS
jgi:hypothetical protein